MKQDPRLWLGILGNLFALALFLVPSRTFRRIVLEETTGHFSGIPYVMTWLNCLLSTWYGLPFVSPDNWLVSIINGAGIFIEFTYVALFLTYAPNNRERVKIVGLMLLALSFFLSIALVSMLACDGNDRKRLCGVITTVFSILMYASPLTVMRRVMRTRNVESMPFLLSVSVFLCGTTWMVFGILGKDLFVIIPNGVGCALGLMQLLLWVIYRNQPAPPENPQAPAPANNAQAPADNAQALADNAQALAPVEIAG